MAYNHRKILLDFSLNESELCPPFCDPANDSGFCPTICLSVCSSICQYSILIPPPDDPPTSSIDVPNKTHKLYPALIVTLTILSAIFLLVISYAIYVKFYSRRRSQPQPQPDDETHDEFLDEEHGPVLDHPIWYINTVGLQPSIISAIAVCKYKRGEGLVEGTECSVCLNEFQEDETLRLLPKCSHAFHIPCIDTWLRSHTNCPMCRAGIVTNSFGAPSAEPNVGSSGSVEETQMQILENNGPLGRERVDELGIGTEEEGELQADNERKRLENSRGDVDDIQPIRRSVSMDSITASKISLALAKILPVESDGNSENRLVKSRESNTGTISKRMGGNQSLVRLMGSSSIGRSLQHGPSSIKRSFSCSGKFLLSRYSRSRNSVLPL
ncbi:hypothetical protein L1049_012559 [Liquidambar formosana]|uniref:RING-type E3 ubiquitin transferase n=1 Tax=Liquidambar formosana TaxID=63359 RepID=A0AAP0R2W4_LIQFO